MLSRRHLLELLGGAMASLPLGVARGAGLSERPLLARGLGPAPRRERLTKTIGGGIAPRPNIAGISGGLPLTFMYAVPIEAPCYAVRLGFGNCFNADMTILSAAVWPSDSYGRCPVMQAANGAADTTDVAPTGGALASKIYFDNAGADAPGVNPVGDKRAFELPAVGGNVKNARIPYTIQWSDFAPCTSIPRADGNPRPLLFIYVTVSSDSISSDASRLRIANLDPLALRGRTTYRGVSWRGGADRAESPGGSPGWKDAGNAFGPLFCLQYLTTNPGIQIVMSGDSLATAPTNDLYSTSVHRAAWDLSTPALPIEVANLAWGATSWPVYANLMANNVGALHPSAVAYQPLSRNDGGGAAKLQLLLARALSTAEQMQLRFGARAIYNSPGCEPSWNGNAQNEAGFVDLRARLNELARTTGAPVIDGPSVIGEPDAPWNYRPGFSDDNTHQNYAGAERVVPLARAALAQVIGEN